MGSAGFNGLTGRPLKRAAKQAVAWRKGRNLYVDGCLWWMRCSGVGPGGSQVAAGWNYANNLDSHRNLFRIGLRRSTFLTSLNGQEE
jgi:hypothetical protein